jgi:hypothetical protein
MSTGAWAQAQGQIRRLTRQQQRVAGYEANWDNYEFVMVPTCPPSTSVVVRGGWVHTAVYTGFGFSNHLPDMTILMDRYSYYVDLYESYVFSAAGNYLPLVVVLFVNYEDGEWKPYPELWNPELFGNGYPDAHRLPEDWQDYTSYLEAEHLIDAALGDVIGAFGGIIMGGVVLRNNGNLAIGDPWQILPVDPINRGGSYLYRDVRQRYLI